MAVGVIADGEVILSKGYGVRDIRSGAAVDEKTVFAIGSCTKAFTSFILSQLVAEQSIQWNHPVNWYLPDFAFPLNLTDITTHRSGFARHDELWYANKCSREEVVEELKESLINSPF